MPAEFPGIAATSDGSEIASRSGDSFDKDYTLALAHRLPAAAGHRGRGELFDRALWTRTAAVTGGAGNSNALVGPPETVARAILDYVDLGVDIISMRGYDLLADAIDVGRQVIPIVRQEVARRDAAAA
jgi:alkanesulfonate monooxygenase SsuD/methylene tetrahydromethanopterin reductase-like flavin-dependent oxidoreductase (luciferase family)